MSSPNTISADKLQRLIGLPKCPHIIDVRTEEDFEAAQRLIPGAVRRSWQSVASWAGTVSGEAVVVCQRGLKLSHGVAAWLRHARVEAVVLEEGMEGWLGAGMPAVPTARIPRARRRWPHVVGHPRAPEDRPDRLPVADPAVHRPRSDLSFRGALRSQDGR